MATMVYDLNLGLCFCTSVPTSSEGGYWQGLAQALKTMDRQGHPNLSLQSISANFVDKFGRAAGGRRALKEIEISSQSGINREPHGIVKGLGESGRKGGSSESRGQREEHEAIGFRDRGHSSNDEGPALAV